MNKRKRLAMSRKIKQENPGNAVLLPIAFILFAVPMLVYMKLVNLKSIESDKNQDIANMSHIMLMNSRRSLKQLHIKFHPIVLLLNFVLRSIQKKIMR